MRRLAALAITLFLGWLVVGRYIGTGETGGTGLALGLALLAASIVGWLCAFVRLPRVTGYIVLACCAVQTPGISLLPTWRAISRRSVASASP